MSVMREWIALEDVIREPPSRDQLGLATKGGSARGSTGRPGGPSPLWLKRLHEKGRL
jgi:hypothetical protein